MTGALQHADDGDVVPCVRCGAPAAGPCASCRDPVCGDCSTLTTGGVRTWAVCLGCADRRGGKLSGAWGGLVLWLVAIFVGIAAATWLVEMLIGYAPAPWRE